MKGVQLVGSRLAPVVTLGLRGPPVYLSPCLGGSGMDELISGGPLCVHLCGHSTALQEWHRGAANLALRGTHCLAWGAAYLTDGSHRGRCASKVGRVLRVGDVLPSHTSSLVLELLRSLMSAWLSGGLPQSRYRRAPD